MAQYLPLALLIGNPIDALVIAFGALGFYEHAQTIGRTNTK